MKPDVVRWPSCCHKGSWLCNDTNRRVQTRGVFFQFIIITMTRCQGRPEPSVQFDVIINNIVDNELCWLCTVL